MEPNGQNNDPLVRLGQGEYARDIGPDETEQSCGAVIAVYVLLVAAMAFAFIAGLLIGGAL